MDMRDVLTNACLKLMEENDRVVFVDADLARTCGTYPIHQKYPERTVDVGIAEQNMASVAAGIASYGYIPFITSFGVFASRRIADQIALSICYADMNVKIMGVDPGLSAEMNGGTHMAMEDVGVLRSIENLVIVEPSDPCQLSQVFKLAADYKGPVYLRIYRKEGAPLYGPDYKMDLFKADILREGSDVTLGAAGTMVNETLEAASLLSEKGVSAEVINFHTIKPLDEETLLSSTRKTGCAVMIQNHNVIGGLYSAASEISARRHPIPMEVIGASGRFGEVGMFGELKKAFGMTAEDIADKALSVIERRKEAKA